MWRLALVGIASLFLALCGVRIVATAEDVPPPIVVNLSEGIGVAGGQQALGPATGDLTEPIAVGDPTGVFPPATAAPTEGIRVSDVVTVIGPAFVTLTEGISIGDAVTIQLPDADVYAQLSVQPETANPGAQLTYLVTLGNHGPAVATGARFTFTPPASTTFVSIDGGFACTAVASGLDCRSTQGSAFSVASGATAAFHLVVNVAANATGPLVATVTATADASDPTAANNTATLSTPLNGAPTVTPAAAQTASEGTSASVAVGSFADDASGPWTVTIDWGDGAPNTTRTVQSAGTLGSETHTYAEGPASLTVRVQVTDRWGLSGEASFTVSVANVPPAAVALTLAAIDEAGTATLSGSFSDPGVQDTHSVVIDWKDGGAPTTITLPAGTLTFSATRPYADDAPTATPADAYTIGVVVTDDDGGSAQGTTTLTVRNVAPMLGAIAGPTGPQAAGTSTNISAPFTDVGTLDTHIGTWSWGDGSTSSASIVESNGAGTASGSHSYAAPGVYTVTLTLTDDDTGTASATFRYVVVYDASVGFVTGGGWIASPAGAYVADASLTGRASFGFVSRYQRGQSVPSGSTQFQFQAADLSLRSTSYDWLVIAGARAQYKGVGTINGSGDYGFMLTAVDGQTSGGGGTDRIRIKIWDRATGDVVYDNQVGAEEEALPSTVLGGGSIVIHQ
jgi:uncharacterized repeat protein (TIGR01451 family)